MNVLLLWGLIAPVTFAQDSPSIKDSIISIDKEKVEQTISFKAFGEIVAGSIPIDPYATASSELLVNYTSSDTLVAKVKGGKIIPLRKGTAIITASQKGNDKFSAATDVSQVLTVVAAESTRNNFSRSSFKHSKTLLWVGAVGGGAVCTAIIAIMASGHSDNSTDRLPITADKPPSDPF